MSAAPESLLHCSFCSKSQQEVRKLIAGPGVYVCDECIALCNGILEHDGLGALTLEHRDVVGADTLLAHLRALTTESDDLVEHLRARGVGWDRIADALRR